MRIISYIKSTEMLLDIIKSSVTQYARENSGDKLKMSTSSINFILKSNNNICI